MPINRKTHASRPAPPWLTQRPVAHRGLHDVAAGRVENSLAAFKAAMAAGCAIELDVQLTADDDVIAFHDDNLKRLCDLDEPVRGMRVGELRKLTYLHGPGSLPSLADVCALVGGKVPLIIEIKTDWQSPLPRAQAVARALSGYAGEAALMSFDPQIMRTLREGGVSRPLGLVADMFEKERWPGLSWRQRFSLRHFLDWKKVAPDFLAYRVDDLPHGFVSRQRARGLPVLAWTVRTPEQLEAAHHFADAAIFEGLDPAAVRQKHESKTLAGG